MTDKNFDSNFDLELKDAYCFGLKYKATDTFICKANELGHEINAIKEAIKGQIRIKCKNFSSKDNPVLLFFYGSKQDAQTCQHDFMQGPFDENYPSQTSFKIIPENDESTQSSLRDPPSLNLTSETISLHKIDKKLKDLAEVITKGFQNMNQRLTKVESDIESFKQQNVSAESSFQDNESLDQEDQIDLFKQPALIELKVENRKEDIIAMSSKVLSSCRSDPSWRDKLEFFVISGINEDRMKVIRQILLDGSPSPTKVSIALAKVIYGEELLKKYAIGYMGKSKKPREMLPWATLDREIMPESLENLIREAVLFISPIYERPATWNCLVRQPVNQCMRGKGKKSMNTASTSGLQPPYTQ